MKFLLPIIVIIYGTLVLSQHAATEVTPEQREALENQVRQAFPAANEGGVQAFVEMWLRSNHSEEEPPARPAFNCPSIKPPAATSVHDLHPTDIKVRRTSSS